MSKTRILVLWNHTGEDIYARWKEEGPASVEWDPEETAVEVASVQDEMDALVAGLRAAGYDVDCVNVRDELERVMAAIRLREPDLVVNLIEFFHEDEGLEANVAALYELLGVAYTGSRAGTLLTCQNKVRTKMLLEQAGLPTPPYMVVQAMPVPVPSDRGLEFPLIVKPAYEDASGGIDDDSVVWDYEALCDRVQHVLEWFEQPALVEEYIDGREIHAAVLGNDSPEVLPLFEMEFDDSEFRDDDEEPRPAIISYNAKWDPTTAAFYSMEAVCPARVDHELEQRIHRAALGAFRVMECRDYARVDMRIDSQGRPYILEINPNPDLAVGGAFELCASASGRSYPDTLSAIVEAALGRQPPEDDDEDGEDRVETTDVMVRRHRSRDAA